MLKTNISLKKHSNYKIGGLAKYFLVIKKIKDLEKYFDLIKKEKLLILGGGTNILFSDDGFNGFVIKPKMIKIKLEGDRVRAGAGVQMKDLVNFFTKKGFKGLDWAGGLPGTVGGAIYGNAGAFCGEMKDSVLEVVSLDFSGENLKTIKRNNQECFFDYRSSIFKSNQNKEMIIEVILKAEPGNKSEIEKSVKEKIIYRKNKQPIEYPNAGSTFKNIKVELVPSDVLEKFGESIKQDPFPVVPVACLLADAELKGVSIGGAMISTKHPNFIINFKNAKSEDVKELIKLAKQKVKDKFGINLEEEIIYVN